MSRANARAKANVAPIDAETRLNDEHHISLRLWLRLLSCTNQIEAHVRHNLQRCFSTTLPRFDLMAQLERAPEGLKMSELSQRMMVTGGNVTGIADGLQKEGLVVREVDPLDRRAVRVKLTPEGSRQFARMAADHEQWLIGLFGKLSARQRRELMDLLGQLKQFLQLSTRQ